MRNALSFIFYVLLLSSGLKGEGIFEVPDGLTLETRRDGGKPSATQKFIDEANGAMLLVRQLPFVPAHEKDLFMKAFAKGQGEQIKQDSEEEKSMFGYRATHIKSHQVFNEVDKLIRIETVIIFCFDRTVAMTLIWKGEGKRPDYLEEALATLNVVQDREQPDNSGGVDTSSSAYKAGEKVGYYGFFVVLGVGAVFLIRRLIK